uniref:AAA domain-containing protein n=1 Tax=Syphacia muris TaxID=451379 RepID=A0A0N5ABA4_9BILA
MSRSASVGFISDPKLLPRIRNHQHMNKQQNERTERDGLSGLTNGTKIFLNVHPEKATVKFSDLGGCERQCLDVCRLSIHLKHPEVHKQLGVTPPRGILLHGPPGCGKTLFAEAVAGELDVPLLRVASTELIAGITGESEEKIRSLFSLAVANAPCVLLLDEIDAIAPKRESTSREMEKRVVSQLISCLDEMLSEESSLPPQHVLVIGTTSRVDSIETALRRAGRFDKEVALGIPDEKARLAILRIVCRGIRLDENIHMEEIAKLTPGYVGADLKALAREAALCSVNRFKKIFVLQGQISGLCVTTSDFEKALSMVHPSAKREGFATVPNVSWKDIGALKAVREELLWSILYPIKRPEEFELLGLKNRPQGLLLCGPPGCGKTLLAKAVANESGMNFISVKGPELLSMYVGESERAVRVVFQRARDSSPCVIFFDEIDALCPKRSGHETSGSARLVNQLLTEMDGMDSRKQVFLIGATNRPDIVDPAILRPGRLDKILFVDFPNLSDKVDILEKLTANRTHPCIASDVSFAEIASLAEVEWFTGADLAALIHEASIVALKQRINDNDTTVNCVTREHFLVALKTVKPSVPENDRKTYLDLKERYGRK